ncbi:uncharacterized protein LOC115625222 [Scaptodrosophila lebanonensis]|uniref:Uncharacterized protein LOC115625222 n=1 Tax=Drosophila lebanonensis TaxID=7225 RepID=A0A6J2TKQ1_DROLE|nr:uncharacterized protein LOC115625222 [Scaptodrosophila lebanonensis]
MTEKNVDSIEVPHFKYEQFQEVLRALPVDDLWSFAENEEDVDKLCEDFLTIVRRKLSLEEVSSLYTISIMVYLLGPTRDLANRYGQRVQLLGNCFNYSDTLKPTMIDYATRNMLQHFKLANKQDEAQTDYMLQLLQVIPHMLVASETGKMISFGLLRAFIAELSGSGQPIIMHIYRNITELWYMIKQINLDTVLEEWPLRKIYILTKSFALLMNSAAFGANTALKQAGYRGFELPANMADIKKWFDTLRNKIEEKHKDNKAGKNLVRLIDFNILMPETENEVGT